MGIHLRRVLRKVTFTRVVAGTAVVLLLTSGAAYAANEWTGVNIVNGSLTSIDIKDNNLGSIDVLDGSLRGADLAANSLTGNQINESSLGKVPDANTVDGIDSSRLQSLVEVQQGGGYTAACTEEVGWSECAAVTVAVPPGRNLSRPDRLGRLVP